MASFIQDREKRHEFRNKHKIKSKFRKLRDDNKRLFIENKQLFDDNKRLFRENAQIRSEILSIKKHIDLRYTSFINTFYDLGDIKYKNPDLRILQQVNLILLKKFKRLCDQKNIEYWLDWGTLLGSIRHKGFIPWDDDIDLGMTRENFIKLEDALLKDNELILNYHYIISSFGQKIGRVFLKEKEDLAFLDIYIYDFLDIEDKEQFQSFFKTVRNQLNKQVKAIRDSKNLELTDKGYMKLDPKEAKTSYIDELFIKFLSNFKIKTEGQYMKNLTHILDVNKIHRSSSVFPLKTSYFEGDEFTIPNNIDEYLKCQYKNYMELPADVGFPHHEEFEFEYEQIQSMRNFIKDYSKYNNENHL